MGVKKKVTKYNVSMSAQEMKCIVEVIGCTTSNDRKNSGCTEEEAETGDAIYEVFVSQLRQDGYIVNTF